MHKTKQTMKKLITIAFTLAITACSTIRPLPTEGWTSSGNYILYRNDTVAHLKAMELSIDNRKWVSEMTFQFQSLKHANKAKDLLWYIHTRYPKYEVELDLPINQSLPQE